MKNAEEHYCKWFRIKPEELTDESRVHIECMEAFGLKYPIDSMDAFEFMNNSKNKGRTIPELMEQYATIREKETAIEFASYIHNKHEFTGVVKVAIKMQTEKHFDEWYTKHKKQ